ncbi:MAG: hypothetical protein ACE5FF_12160 [Saprospiraceae bacterium]
MKKIVFILALFVLHSGCLLSQVQVTVASSGTVIGTYDDANDAITLDANSASNYIAQKYTGENVDTFYAEKEGLYAYLVVESLYTIDDNTYRKITAETLSPSVGVSQFPIPDECEEHTCDGGCGGNIIENCSHCLFDKKNGKIIGCKCRDTGFCCHTVKSVPCANK